MAVANRTTPAGPYAAALRVLGLAVGLFFLFNGLDKRTWLFDSSLLDERLREWLENAAPSVRWYIETLATPGVPLFARLVPPCRASYRRGTDRRLLDASGRVPRADDGGEFQLREGDVSLGRISDRRRGFPVTGGLLALTIAGTRLPFSVSKF